MNPAGQLLNCLLNMKSDMASRRLQRASRQVKVNWAILMVGVKGAKGKAPLPAFNDERLKKIVLEGLSFNHH